MSIGIITRIGNHGSSWNRRYRYPRLSAQNVLLLDESGLGSAAAAYSVRKLRSAYSDACMRIRRSSDSIEGDFGFVNNVLSSSSVISNSSTRVTAFGNAQIDTAQSKFGGASGLFDGTVDYLTVPSSSDFHFGAGDFTVETWVRWTAISGLTNVLVGDVGMNGGAGNWVFYYKIGTSQLEFYFTTAGTLGTSQRINSGSWTPTLNQWYHVAVTRSGNNFRIFIDGTQSGSTQTSSSKIFNESRNVFVGGNTDGGHDWYLEGHLDDLRITKGVARYTANFTPPASAHPIGNSDPYWANVVLLLPMDGSDGSTTFTDQSLTDKTLSQFCNGTDGFVAKWYDQSGNARNLTQSTASYQPKIVSSGAVITGAGSKPQMDFDGSNDRLLTSAFAYSTNLTVMAVAKQRGGWGSAQTLWDELGYTASETGMRLADRTSTPTMRLDVNGPAISPTLNTSFLVTQISAASRKIRLNANSESTGTVAGDTSHSGVIIGIRSDGIAATQVSTQEWILWTSELGSTEQSTARSNINTYYSIY